MKKSLFIYICAVFAMWGCSKEKSLLKDDFCPELQMTKALGISNNITPRSSVFTEEMLKSLVKSTSFKGEFSTECVYGKARFNSESPVMYVLNFENGGWMLVAGHVRETNQILAYSQTGTFNPEEIVNPELKFWYEMVKSQMENVEIIQSEEIESLSYLPPWIEPDQEYYWVRLSLPVIRTGSSSSVNHLIETKWGQDDPWNALCPGEPKRRTGCVATAFAQILYYLHENKSFTIPMWDIIIPSFTYRNVYSEDAVNDSLSYYEPDFYTLYGYNSNSTKWHSMPRWQEDNGSSEYVAQLMVDVARIAGMKYYLDSSTSSSSPDVLVPYGVECEQNNYSFNIVKRSLDNGYPVVLSVANQTDTRVGHCWLIDGYSYDDRVIDAPYQWKIIPSDSLSFYSNINYDYVFSERQKQMYYPEVEENEIIHNYTPGTTGTYLLMNWGYDGQGDDGFYSLLPEWTYGEDNYNRSPQIVYNFRQ